MKEIISLFFLGFAKSFTAWPLAGMAAAHHSQSFNPGTSNGSSSGYPYGSTGTTGSASPGYAMYAAAAAAAVATSHCGATSSSPTNCSSLQNKEEDFQSLSTLRLKAKHQLDYGNYSTSATSTTGLPPLSPIKSLSSASSMESMAAFHYHTTATSGV